MQDLSSAIKLSEIMVSIGNSFGKRTVAIISDMDKPLGKAVGNSLEVIEAIELLKGNGCEDLKTICIELAAMMIFLAKKANSIEEAKKIAIDIADSGKALTKFKELVKMQGGDMHIFEDYSAFPQASMRKELVAHESGYICAVDAQKVGIASQVSGAGRFTKEDKIDLSAGVYLNIQIGDKVEKGDLLAIIYGNDKSKLDSAYLELENSFDICNEQPKETSIVKKIVGIDQELNIRR